MQAREAPRYPTSRLTLAPAQEKREQGCCRCRSTRCPRTWPASCCRAALAHRGAAVCPSPTGDNLDKTLLERTRKKGRRESESGQPFSLSMYACAGGPQVGYDDFSCPSNIKDRELIHTKP